jgi:FixJ family two-component response regulator
MSRLVGRQASDPRHRGRRPVTAGDASCVAQDAYPRAVPGRSGRELAETLRDGGLADRVLYMSGYSSDAFGSQRALDPSETIIHKPFSEGALLDAVRSALGSHARPTARAVN